MRMRASELGTCFIRTAIFNPALLLVAGPETKRPEHRCAKRQSDPSRPPFGGRARRYRGDKVSDGSAVYNPGIGDGTCLQRPSRSRGRSPPGRAPPPGHPALEVTV